MRSRLGTYNIKAGQYLMVRGDEEPEIARGSFSRDRFDMWVAERMEPVNETQSASVRYVGDQYAGDVASLDGYGDWEYDSAYGGNVWSPRVEADWTPYSNGSWYYTPAGLTWWSSDPWGWYPHHYGNWFLCAQPLVLGARLRVLPGLGLLGLLRRLRWLVRDRLLQLRVALVGLVPQLLRLPAAHEPLLRGQRELREQSRGSARMELGQLRELRNEYRDDPGQRHSRIEDRRPARLPGGDHFAGRSW